ncbi:MAG TPA: YbbR-like domain-containing protein [Polyangiaceae bacterium]|nr:YbbR-like domain-containing protein [Polyangiaceae bacterium]
MTAKDGWRGAIRSAALDNLSLKILSLVCALGVYAFIHGAENVQRTMAVSVVSIMPPETANRQLLSPLPTEVAVTVQGSRTHLDDLRAEDLGSLQLDLRSGRETRIDLDSSMFHVPVGVAVVQIYPATLEVKWDDVISRQISVQIPRTGELKADLVIKGAPVPQPPVVNARGPRTVVEVLQFARTLPFDVTGLLEGEHRRTLALDKPPKLVTYDVENVVAIVNVSRELVTKPFTNLKVEVVGVARATTKPTFVTVSFSGTAEDVNAIQSESLVPRVEPKTAENVDTLKPGSAYLDVLIDVPPRVKAEVQPPKVLVKW